MSKEEFLIEMQDVLQTEVELTMDTILDNLDEWDSLSMMSTVAFLGKNFGVSLKLADFKEMNTIGDIAAKAGL